MAAKAGEPTKTMSPKTEKQRKELHDRVEERLRHQKERFRSVTKTRKSAETRKRIMTTASDLMTERGSTAFQMSEISKRCGMSKGALYYYFSDKEDLLSAIFDDEVKRLVVSIDNAVSEATTGEEALRGACHAYAGCVINGGPLAMALVRELVISRDDFSSSMDKSLKHIVEVVAHQIERAQTEGVVRSDVNVRLAAISVCGAYAFSAMMAAVDGESAKTADFAEELFQLIVNGVGVRE